MSRIPNSVSTALYCSRDMRFKGVIRHENSTSSPMKRIVAVLAFLLGSVTGWTQPVINSITFTSAARSSRILVQGAGFGASQGAARVAVGGISAPVTRWTNTLIAAYIPEASATGPTNVQVFDAQGLASNSWPVTVTLRPGQMGHFRWRFQVDGDYIQSRPAVASDGTVYTQDVYGHLYALAPDGGLKWIFNSPGYGNISVGSDGAIYIGTTTSIFALTPMGSVLWQFNQNPAAFLLLGPNVGPDGNIYAVGTQGMGVFSLTPQGKLRWSVPENYDRPIVTLQEIVFGPTPQSRLYFHANRHLRGLGLDGSQIFTFPDGLDTAQGIQQPAVAPDGSVYSNLFTYPGPGIVLGKFDSSGNELWHIFDQLSTSTNVVSTPDIGSDGVIYDGQNLLTLYAINPNGSVRWKYTDTETLFAPVISPLNNQIFLGGASNGQPGFFEVVSTAGALLWKNSLPVENGLNVVPMSRPRFTPDGQTVYIGTSIPGQASNGYSYLYSVQTGTGVAAVSLASLTLNPTTVKGGTASRGTVTLSGPAPTGGVTVKLASGNTAVATVPVSVLVPAGSVSASFTVNTKPVTVKRTPAISATCNGVRKKAVLTVTP